MVEKEELLNSFKGIKIIEDINSNAAAIGILSAATIAILSNIIKLMAYSYYCGWFDYYQINREYINVTSANFLYSIAFSSSIGLIFVALNYIVYNLIINKEWKNLSFAFICIGIFNIIFLFFNTNYIQIVNNFSINDLLAIIISCFIIIPFIEYLLGILGGVIHLIRTKKIRKKKINSYDKNTFTPKILMFSIIGIIIIYIPISYWFGHYNAQIINTFKTINNQYVVIYEAESEYLIADCNIDFNHNLLEINKDKQTYINKVNVETEKIQFKVVKLN